MYSGPDRFTYQASDGTADSAVATVNLTVTPSVLVPGPVPVAPPVANNDHFVTAEETPLTVAAPGVLGNDSDPEGGPLSVSLGSGPSHGILRFGADGSFVYTPDAFFVGSDQFTYLASNGTSTSRLATVDLIVTPVNHAPEAIDDHFTTDEGTTLTIVASGVLANDGDADGDQLSAILVGVPAHGTLTLHGDGSFVYTPDPFYAGPDQFSYLANDGLALSRTATVSLTIHHVNHAPQGVDDRYTTFEDNLLTIPAPGLLANDTDADGDSLATVLVAGPSHGTVALGVDGAFTYTPAAGYSGPDLFTYGVSDGNGGSSVATVLPYHQSG